VSFRGFGDIIVTPKGNQPGQKLFQGGPWGNKTQSPPPGGIWTPNEIVPEQYLPAALQQTIPLTDLFQPNDWDRDLFQEAALWRYVALHGGIKNCCRIDELGAPIWSQPPWQVMPSNGLILQQMFAATTASIPFTGTDTVIGTYRIPSGFDGAINRFVAQFSGNGHIDFSGDIVWRLKINNRYAKNLGNVTNTYGSFQTAFIVPGDAIPVISGQNIQVIVNIPATSGVNGGYVQGGFFGWEYGRR